MSTNCAHVFGLASCPLCLGTAIIQVDTYGDIIGGECYLCNELGVVLQCCHCEKCKRVVEPEFPYPKQTSTVTMIPGGYQVEITWSGDIMLPTEDRNLGE